jgi:hypothetical protein
VDPDVLGAGVIGALVIASAVVFAALALKSKSVRSFSFQFSIFMIMWAAAEVPAVLSSAGVLVTTAYENVGLELHLLSMFGFGTFVFLRARNSFGEMRLGQIGAQAAYSGVSKAIDAGGAKALGFYVDYGLAVRDPKKFDSMLRKVFSSGSSVIEKNILDELYTASGIHRVADGDQDFVTAISRATEAARKI